MSRDDPKLAAQSFPGPPHTRLRRIAQAIVDTVGKPLAECRILDLACLEGQFTVEMALHGAEAVGIEIRDTNIAKTRSTKAALDLSRVTFHQDDVRNISVAKYGTFDAIICSGILYHLPADDVIALIGTMYEMGRVVVIDTHIALAPEVRHGDYWGRYFLEHAPGASEADKARSLWASADNETSFWFTRPSLVNILTRAGFSSVAEWFTPTHLNFGEPGVQFTDRCTFVAIRGEPVKLATSPGANDLREDWPERSLTYEVPVSLKRRIVRKLLGR